LRRPDTTGGRRAGGGHDATPRRAGLAGLGSHTTIVVGMDSEFPRLIGAHEIRDLLGVSRQRVYQLAGQSGFPKPVATLAQGKIWAVDEVETWIDTHRSKR